MSTLISLVDSGMGVALLPESAARLRDAKVVACTIRDRLPPSQIGMIVSKTNDAPVVEKFCELASQIKAWTHLELETVFLMDDWGRHGSAIGKGSTPEEQLEFFVAKYSPKLLPRSQNAVLTKMRSRYSHALELLYDNYNVLAIGFSPAKYEPRRIG
jgi:hypothetical protein